MELVRAVYLMVIRLSGMFFLAVVRLLFLLGFIISVFAFCLAIIMLIFGGASLQDFGTVIVGSIVGGVSLLILNKVFLDEV